MLHIQTKSERFKFMGNPTLHYRQGGKEGARTIIQRRKKGGEYCFWMKYTLFYWKKIKGNPGLFCFQNSNIANKDPTLVKTGDSNTTYWLGRGTDEAWNIQKL